MVVQGPGRRGCMQEMADLFRVAAPVIVNVAYWGFMGPREAPSVKIVGDTFKNTTAAAGAIPQASAAAGVGAPTLLENVTLAGMSWAKKAAIAAVVVAALYGAYRLAKKRAAVHVETHVNVHIHGERPQQVRREGDNVHVYAAGIPAG